MEICTPLHGSHFNGFWMELVSDDVESWRLPMRLDLGGRRDRRIAGEVERVGSTYSRSSSKSRNQNEFFVIKGKHTPED
jgi:hypothetical protein